MRSNDTLYAVNGKLEPKPQMAEGHTVSDDGRVYLIMLREGLKFHDGEPVRDTRLRAKPGTLGSTRHDGPDLGDVRGQLGRAGRSDYQDHAEIAVSLADRRIGQAGRK